MSVAPMSAAKRATKKATKLATQKPASPSPRTLSGLTFYFYKNKHIAGPHQHPVLLDPLNPLRRSMVERNKVRDKREPLWWNVITAAVSSKKTIRSWSKRRVSNAFREVLYKTGLDETGKAYGRFGRTVNGTLRIHVKPESIPMKYDAIKRDCEKLLWQVQQKAQRP